jgi:hypothetical protein
LDSELGDYIGQGEQRAITEEDGSFTGEGNTNIVSINFDGGGGFFWYAQFAAPSGAVLAPGAYEGATRHPFQLPQDPGLSIFGEGRGCNTLTGRFDVVEAVYGATGVVERFAAEFEQHCEGGEPALFGHVLFDASSLVESIGIDIRPGNAFNSINPASRGVIPVAILGSEIFEVADVDVTTVAFAPEGAPLAHRKGPHVVDANHDGLDDLLAHFRSQETGIAYGD